MYKICFIAYYSLPKYFDHFYDHHQGSFTRTQQTAKLYKWNHWRL